MEKLRLIRDCNTEIGVFGILHYRAMSWFTCEPPWKDNRPGVSCIPSGVYQLVRDTTGAHRYWRVLDVPGRSDIEIHVGNTILDTEGCILLGRRRVCVAGLWAVGSSAAALEAFMLSMEDVEEAELEITWALNLEPSYV